jgi:hypothetical protein
MKKKLSQLIPFGVAVMLVLIHVIQVLTTASYLNENGETGSYSIVDTVQYASIGLAITLILIILKKDIWKYMFLILILLSFTGLIQFYNQTFSIGIGPLSLEMTALGLLIFHLAMNPDIISKIKLKLEPSEESLKKKEELKKKQFENSVNRFEGKFKSKQKNELERIVNENSLIPEAVEAARRLLKKE